MAISRIAETGAWAGRFPISNISLIRCNPAAWKE
jgi:hypothetical protein